MKVIIAGSRNINDYNFIKRSVLDFEKQYGKITEIVSGTAKGVDQLGEKFALEFGLKLKKFPADWNKYGKRAGYLRNKQMGDYADALVAVWDGKSRGTAMMIEIMMDLEKSFKIYRSVNE